MSKILYLVRHAKAHEGASGQKDFERELTNTGISDVSRVGNRLFERGVKIQKMVASDAARASLTAELLSEQLKYPFTDIVFDRELYEASVRSLLSYVNQTASDIDQLMVVGHNPVLTYFAEYVTGEQIGSIPTSGTVALEFNIKDWTEVGADTGKVKFIEQPPQESN